MLKFKQYLDEQELLNEGSTSASTLFEGVLVDCWNMSVKYNVSSKWSNNKDQKKFNISFVTKKKIGNAVKRNKIKRRLRNIMNEAVKKVEINFDYSFLVIAKSSMLNNEYKNIKETLFQDLEKIK